MAAIAAAAVLVARRAGRSAGLLTAVLLGAAPFHVRYSQELRPYSLALLLLCVSLLCLDRWLERGRFGDLALLYVSCLATAYTLYLAAFVLPLAAAGLLAEDSFGPDPERRRRARRFLLWSPVFAGALLLGYLPWCPVVLDVSRRPPLTAAVPVTVAWVGRILSFLSLAPDETTGLSLPAFGYVLLALIGLGVCARTPRLRFLVVWAVGGLAGIEILSQIHPHFDAARRFLPAGLALTLGAAVGLARIARMRGGRAAATLLLAAILLFDGRAVSIYIRSGRPDWRLLAAALQTRLTPGQQIFSSNPWTQLCLGFYLRPHDRGRRPGPGDLSVVNVDGDIGRLEGAWTPGTAAWLVLAGEPRSESLRRWAERFPVFSVPEADGAEVRRLGPGLRGDTHPDSHS